MPYQILLCAAASSAVGGTVRDTEWGMVGLGIIIGAAFALVLGFVFHLLSEYWHKGTVDFLYKSQTDCLPGPLCSASGTTSKLGAHEQEKTPNKCFTFAPKNVQSA